MKFKAISGILLTLLSVSVLPLTFDRSAVEAQPSPEVAIAAYDYYVVAGYQMAPRLPPPVPQPPGFQFTCSPTGYNMGSIQHNPGRNCLYEGVAEAAPAKDTNACVVVNITNLLGYDLTILDLTAEVTDGTSIKPWLWYYGWMSNTTLVAVDTLDPWDPTAPPQYIFDEVEYQTGIVQVHRDWNSGDWYKKAVGVPKPPVAVGPASLLENDVTGDAAATGHVKPIQLPSDSTLTEYFGIVVFGDVDVGMQINATITLRLTYTPPPEGGTAICGVYVADLYPCFPLGQFTDEGFPSWEFLWLNCTVWNWGNVPINVTVNIYVSYQQFHNGGPMGGTRLIYLGSQNISMPVCDRTRLSLRWNVRASDIGTAWCFLTANATATSGNLTATDDGFVCQFKSRVIGDADGDDDNDVGDQRRVQLVMFTQYSDERYLLYNTYPWFTDIDADGDVDVGDQRKQQFHCFETW